MNASTKSKSCGPQQFPEGEPTELWTLDELGKYAQRQHRQIVANEQKLAQIYWRLGRALVFARNNFMHGQWGLYLQELGIDRTRASKAKAVFRTFPAIEDLESLTVEEAYARRKRKEPPSVPSQQGNSGKPRKSSQMHALVVSLRQVNQYVNRTLDQISAVKSSQATRLLSMTAKAIEALQELQTKIREAHG